MRSWPPASTATVPVASVALWPRASMPRARPDTTTNPASPSARASRSVKVRPDAEALREPTMATIGRARHPARRARAMSGGALSIACSVARIVRLAERDEAGATPRRLRQLALRLGLARHLSMSRAAASRQFGRASSAAPAPPKRLMSVRKVRGPMLSERMSRSQSIRCSSVSRYTCEARRSSLASDPAFRSRRQPFMFFAVLPPQQGGERHERRRHRAWPSAHSTTGVAALATSADSEE